MRARGSKFGRSLARARAARATGLCRLNNIFDASFVCEANKRTAKWITSFKVYLGKCLNFLLIGCLRMLRVRRLLWHSVAALATLWPRAQRAQGAGQSNTCLDYAWRARRALVRIALTRALRARRTRPPEQRWLQKFSCFAAARAACVSTWLGEDQTSKTRVRAARNNQFGQDVIVA